MNKEASPIGNSTFFNQEYVPTSVFMEYLKKASPLPYHSELSIDPFFNQLDHMANGQCPYTKDALSPWAKNAHEHLTVAAGQLKEQKIKEQEVEKMFGKMFPSLFLDRKMSFVSPPFQKTFAFQTPIAKHYFNSGDWMMKLDTNKHKENLVTSVIWAGIFLLETFYDVEVDNFKYQVATLRNNKTNLEKHFEIEINTDYVEATQLKPLKKLSKADIGRLLNNIYDEKIWLDAFPPENFSFKGFMIGTFHDVTRIETMSILKNKVTLSEEEMKPEYFFAFLEQQLRNYLELPKLKFGMVMVTHNDFFNGDPLSLSGYSDLNILKGTEADQSIYTEAFSAIQPLLFCDLNMLEYESSINAKMIKEGFQSMILLPIRIPNKGLVNIVEIAAPEALTFNALTMVQLKEFFDLMHLASEQYLRSLDNMIQFFIQQQFTSIHPSVEWKFEEVATKYEVKRTLPGFDGIIDPIVFKDIYPLYGQADIVSSSTLRNKSIQADLTANLKYVLRLMNVWNDHMQFHLLESYTIKVELILKRIKKEFISSDESTIVELLTKEIHPLLSQLNTRYPELPSGAYQQYLESLDPELDIVYDQRKNYEHSVSQLNSAISTFLEKDDRRMQKILPHYFEKYKTDGVEYNIYLGEAILKEGGFSPFFLKDFRIWQLVNACEITRLVENLSPTLKVPLKTAQLLFVYNNSLSIRFRMDEKQFDVDGSYNVRYEILKKRIDKAVIKGTKDRLTVAGKVAIVYLQDKDRAEYMEYLEYLVQKKYISADIETLELEKLQGAEGLKALRVTVLPANAS